MLDLIYYVHVHVNFLIFTNIVGVTVVMSFILHSFITFHCIVQIWNKSVI